MVTTNAAPVRLPGLTLNIPPADLGAAPPEEGEPYASIEITGLTPAPKENPLDTLSRALRCGGGALAWEHDCFILRGPGGAEVVRGVRRDELALVLGAIEGRAPKSPWTVVRLNRNLLLQVARVRNMGETLSAFLRESMRREIAHRLAEDEAELQDEVRHAA